MSTYQAPPALVVLDPPLICTDTQTGLRYLLFACSKVSIFASPHICFVSFLSLFARKHARNGASNTNFVNTKWVMASIHWSSAQRRSQNAEKLWTSKGDYWIKQWFSSIASLFKWKLLLKERICSQRERIFSFKNSSLYNGHLENS